MKIENTPQCVGFIMDGNRRWAAEHGLPSLHGHARGYETFKTLIATVESIRIPHMVCYAFSTENWKRSDEEVQYLMELMDHALDELSELLQKEGKRVNLRIIGERDKLPTHLQNKIVEVEAKNCEEPDLTVWIALSYGSRAEIVQAVNKAIAEGQSLTEETFEELLWTDGMPDPDLIIRTSGEKRLSNFLLWQAAYSEFFFTDCKWPDFGETEFKSILEQYAHRQRRKGV